MKPFTLRDFVRESNRIEGIGYSGKNLNRDIEAHEYVLSKDILTRPVIESFALRVTRGVGKLRSRPGMDVRVGDHVPPCGGESLVRQYEAWLRDMPRRPFEAHVAFEKLHPFMDGNGRTGRVLWLWQVGGIENAPLGFLHHWYYATLQSAHGGDSLASIPAGGCQNISGTRGDKSGVAVATTNPTSPITDEDVERACVEFVPPDHGGFASFGATSQRDWRRDMRRVLEQFVGFRPASAGRESKE